MRREGIRAERGLPMACDEAPCQAGLSCAKRNGGCLYYDATRLAASPRSRLLVTNYAFWMAEHLWGEGLNPFDMLILDEAHNAIDELGKFVGTELRPGELEQALNGNARVLAEGATQSDWMQWGAYWEAMVAAEIETIKAAVAAAAGSTWVGDKLSYGTLRRVRDLKRIQQKLTTIAHMSGEWIIDHTEDDRRRPIIKFDPVWPGAYAESMLFLGIKKIVMVSATVRPETAMKLGFKPDEIDFREYPSPIPKERRPIIFYPAGAMNRKAAADSQFAWSQAIDQIIARRVDRKGIIHTKSYKRAREVYQGSRFRELMITHDDTNTKEVIERFKKSTRPLVLISPVLTTGYDFPYETAEYQIIAKMPFPVTTDKVVKARAALDKGYRDYVTMVELVQTAGRVCRAPDDIGETIIIDTDFGWWFRVAGRKLCPQWFKEAIREIQILEAPLPKLVRRVA
jgi:Rad3-related DNA helicase